MLKTCCKVVAVAVFVCVSVAGVGVVRQHSIQPIVKCCGGPPPICPGSPGCPRVVAKN